MIKKVVIIFVREFDHLIIHLYCYLRHLLIYLSFVRNGAFKSRLDIIRQSQGTPGLSYWSLQRYDTLNILKHRMFT